VGEFEKDELLNVEQRIPMHLIQDIKRQSITRNAMILLTAMTLSITMATDALAAGPGGGGAGGGHGGGRGGGGHMGDGFSGSFLDRVPPMSPPIFNQASPSIVAPLHETPVSPASPGSIFGNGPGTGAH
jgi:hypothetical protein